jgi:hypothetical protein
MGKGSYPMAQPFDPGTVNAFPFSFFVRDFLVFVWACNRKEEWR